MAYDLYNVDLDPNTIYYNVYSSTLVQPTITTNISGDVITITTINGGGGGQATGPQITISGGLTGMNFVASGNTIALEGTLIIANGGTGATTAAGARTNLGLGTIATQDASNVTITGGSITGITDLAIADGGTGASTAATARTNLSVPRIHTAAVAPAVTDDGAAGFPTGTLWVDTALDDAYISVDDATGAAVWKKITP
jgi:hypothetical protein